MVVEARVAGSDEWTTLPDVSGNELTTDDTGESCPEGLASEDDAPHPFLLNYWERRLRPHRGQVERADRQHRWVDRLDRRSLRLRR